MQSDWLAHYLVRQAGPLNQAYRLARQGDPVRFAQLFRRFVLESLDPLLAGLDHWQPEHKAALAEAAYQSGLTMAQHGWLASEHQAVTDTLFQQLLPDWLSPYPEAAPRLLTQLLNTLAHLPDAQQRAALLTHWQRCQPEPDITPDALVVLGWMSGLPQFREAALAAMHRRPELSTILAIGDPARYAHPWWQGPQRQWHTAAVRLGASVWLGGEFAGRPELRTANRHTFIQAGNDCWQLFIDAFGQTLLPHAQPPESDPAPGCTRLPAHLASHWREADRPHQCLEREHDWVVSFHTSYAVLVIPKKGAYHE